LAVLQTNQEQKYRIESICREKNTIAEEYEAEFNRMNVRYLFFIMINHVLNNFNVFIFKTFKIIKRISYLLG